MCGWNKCKLIGLPYLIIKQPHQVHVHWTQAFQVLAIWFLSQSLRHSNPYNFETVWFVLLGQCGELTLQEVFIGKLEKKLVNFWLELFFNLCKNFKTIWLSREHSKIPTFYVFKELVDLKMTTELRIKNMQRKCQARWQMYIINNSKIINLHVG